MVISRPYLNPIKQDFLQNRSWATSIWWSYYFKYHVTFRRIIFFCFDTLYATKTVRHDSKHFWFFKIDQKSCHSLILLFEAKTCDICLRFPGSSHLCQPALNVAQPRVWRIVFCSFCLYLCASRSAPSAQPRVWESLIYLFDSIILCLVYYQNKRFRVEEPCIWWESVLFFLRWSGESRLILVLKSRNTYSDVLC